MFVTFQGELRTNPGCSIWPVSPDNMRRRSASGGRAGRCANFQAHALGRARKTNEKLVSTCPEKWLVFFFDWLRLFWCPFKTTTRLPRKTHPYGLGSRSSNCSSGSSCPGTQKERSRFALGKSNLDPSWRCLVLKPKPLLCKGKPTRRTNHRFLEYPNRLNRKNANQMETHHFLFGGVPLRETLLFTCPAGIAWKGRISGHREAGAKGKHEGPILLSKVDLVNLGLC